jgi:hypothetical protein
VTGRRGRAKLLAGEMADAFLSRARARELVGGMRRKDLVTAYMPAAVAVVTLVDALRREVRRNRPGPVPESLVDSAAERLASCTLFDPRQFALAARKGLPRPSVVPSWHPEFEN